MSELGKHPSAKQLLQRLRVLKQTLSATYPYAFKVGAWLRVERHQWAAEFAVTDEDAAQLPMAQARDYAFLAYCEEHYLQELDTLLAKQFFPKAPLYLRVELENTVRWYSKQAEAKTPAPK